MPQSPRSADDFDSPWKEATGRRNTCGKCFGCSTGSWRCRKILENAFRTEIYQFEEEPTREESGWGSHLPERL